MIRLKYISHGLADAANGKPFAVGNCLFIPDANCTDYDWLVVYDDFPRPNVGTIIRETEKLCCPREHTILVTAEPPTIKIYPKCYTRQFGHVITTHAKRYLPHPNHHIGPGSLLWMAGYSLEEAESEPEYEKTKQLSAVCSAKQQRHTAHFRRYRLMRYLADHLPELDWYGWGVKPLGQKYEALSPYRYHVAAENYIEDYHWTDKISDPILGLCLTFYAGDPKLEEVLPAESFIRIPLDDPEEALRIIREAMANNEFEKRLPAIREARHRIVTRYNFYRQVVEVINKAMAEESAPPAATPFALRGRHALRRNPLNFLQEWSQITCVRTADLLRRLFS